MDERRWQEGLQIRREVMGAERIDRVMKEAGKLTQPLQNLVTEYAWGEIWGRPGLSRKSRSLVNLGMLVALNRPKELALHIGAALTNGLTKEEIMECFLQTAVYCGVPAGLEATNLAMEIFEQHGLS